MSKNINVTFNEDNNIDVQFANAGNLNLSNIKGQVFVDDLNDFPAPISNTITLANDTAYIITTSIDLENNRLICGARTALIGNSPENCELHNNLDNEAMITSDETLKIANLGLYTTGINATILNLDASTSSNGNNALDWQFVNFTGGDIGTIANYDNIVFDTIGIIDKSSYTGYPNIGNGFIFDGTIGTIAFSNSFFGGFSNTDTAIEILPTATLMRRLRLDNSAFVVTGLTNALDVDSNASIPVEGFILQNINFSGGGTYLADINTTSDKALFRDCRGITNTTAVGYYYMRENAVTTNITAVNTPVKVAGNTTNSDKTSKFTHSNNRLTYNGAITRIFKTQVIGSFSGGNNDQIGVYIAKNGNVILETETYATAGSGGRLENLTANGLIELQQNDYIEVFVENATDADDITVSFLTVIAEGQV